MTAIVVRTFAGLRPAESPRLIRPEEAQEAVNTRLDNGELRAFRAEDPRLEGGPYGLRTIFRHGNTESDYEKWIAWLEEVEYFQTPVHEDEYDRVYWSGQDVPRYAPSQYIFDNAEFAAVERP